jgi:translation initiation factor IF-2
MNAKNVLNKILGLLSSEEVLFTDARTADGTILQSPTFDVGEPVEVVSEDGTKNPAPDGEHEIALRDSEGNENIIKIITKDGKIVERENVELEDVKTEEIPQQIQKDKVNEVPDAKGSVKDGTMMAEETDTAEALPEDTDMPEDEEPTVEIELGKMMEKMQYRIQEMEAKIAKMEETMYPPVASEVVQEEEGIKMSAEPDEEEELPKLDGAPIEDAPLKFSSQKKNNKVGKDAQSSFLSKLYN